MNMCVKISNKIIFILNKLKRIQRNKWFGRMLLIFSFFYPIGLIYLSWEEIKELKWDSLFYSFSISFLLYLVSLLFQSLNWSIIVNGNLSDFIHDSEIYFRTVLMRRLPGGFWHWLGRINFYNVDDIKDKNKIIRANVSEWGALILTGISTFLFVKNYIAGILSFIITFAVLLILRIHAHGRSFNDFLWGLFLVCSYTICWILGGLILNILTSDMILINSLPLKVAFSTWALTGTTGTLVFFLPSGIFIREFSLTALLLPYLGISNIILLALLLRLIFTFSDIIGSLMGLGGIRLIKKLNSVLFTGD